MIEERFLDKRKYSRPGIVRSWTGGIVMHYSAVMGATARNIRDSFNRHHVLRYRSAHFAVDWTGAVIQMMPEMEVAYHVGAWTYQPGIQEKLGKHPNMSTIAIEMCYRDENGKISESTFQYAMLLVVYLCRVHELLPSEDILTHEMITGKACPLWWVDHPEQFDRFKQLVKETLIRRKPYENDVR